jgi:Ca2+/Na+ antiporter
MKPIRANLAYLFLAAGVIWSGLIYLTSSLLILWPAVACVVGGLLLKLVADNKMSNIWAISAAVLGFVLAAYQAFAAVPLLFGAFSIVAIASLVLFFLFAVLHLFLLYGAGVQPEETEEEEKPKEAKGKDDQEG